MAGAFFATKMTMVAPESFTWWESLIVLIIVVLDGMGSIPGVVLGGVVMVAIPELLRDFADYRMLILWAILVLLALFRPKGLWPAGPNRAATAAVAEPPGIRDDGAGFTRYPAGGRRPVGLRCRHDAAFQRATVLADVDRAACAGEIVSLIGPNGTGKTTFCRMSSPISVRRPR